LIEHGKDLFLTKAVPNTIIVNQIERNYCINMTDKFLFCL